MKIFDRETHDKVNGVIIWWMGKACFCVTLSVRVSNLFVGVHVS